MKRIRNHSNTAILEIDYVPNGQWIIILVDKDRRNLVGMFRWQWQCKLFCYINRHLQVKYKEKP